MTLEWNSFGVLPPTNPKKQGADVDRSPYRIPFYQVVDQFGLSRERMTILQGLLRYRKALQDAGILTGFQWLNGSFMEHVENLESRPPNDIDVVTFFELPEGYTQHTFLEKYTPLFDPQQTKKEFHVNQS